MAESLLISALTSFHALKQACQFFGASGNTCMFTIQFGKEMGSEVIARSTKKWITDFGVDLVISEYDNNQVIDGVKKLTQCKMADVVLNPLGTKTWNKSFDSVGNMEDW
jgi:NADPH:quinone reductase-like Zn-dependent oxidoreductase